MNKKTYYDMGVIDSISRCLRLSREWSKKRDECLARSDVAGAREANGKLDACISCAEEITKMLESNMMVDSVHEPFQKFINHPQWIKQKCVVGCTLNKGHGGRCFIDVEK